jgi:hypothetical protein
MENKRGKQILPGDMARVGRGKDMGKGCKRVNMVEICTRVKMEK